MLKRKKDIIHFSGRVHTKKGIISAAIGIAVAVGFIIISIISSASNGNGGMILGFMGLLLLGMSIFGFVLSYKSFKQKDIFYRFPIIGITLNGLMTVVLLIIYILGFGG
jgi:hypothetical protein